MFLVLTKQISSPSRPQGESGTKEIDAVRFQGTRVILVLTKQMWCISETPGGVWYTLNRYSTPSTGGGGGGGGLLVLNRQRLTLGYKYSYLLSSKNASAVP